LLIWSVSLLLDPDPQDYKKTLSDPNPSSLCYTDPNLSQLGARRNNFGRPGRSVRRTRSALGKHISTSDKGTVSRSVADSDPRDPVPF
jgi:hypothetical protein